MMLNEQDTLPPEMALAESLAAPSLRSAAEQAPTAGELPAPWLQLDQAVLQLGPQRFGPYRLALSPGERLHPRTGS
eukprot:gene46695-63257_t